jgi:hypothetical protein
MEVLKIRHILDIILSYLRNRWYTQDYLNLLLALNLTDEYAHRVLKLDHSNFQCLTRDLLYHNLKNFSSDFIRSNFTLFWQTINLDKFNEKFFIDNKDLIDREKLKELKKHCDTNYVTVKRNFSEKFHKKFPLFEELKICRILGCNNEIDFLGQLCSNCVENKCPRCLVVILPKLEMRRGRCQLCLNRSLNSCFLIYLNRKSFK